MAQLATQQRKVPARFQDCSGFSGRAFSCHQSPAPEIETQQIRYWELNINLKSTTARFRGQRRTRAAPPSSRPLGSLGCLHNKFPKRPQQGPASRSRNSGHLGIGVGIDKNAVLFTASFCHFGLQSGTNMAQKQPILCVRSRIMAHLRPKIAQHGFNIAQVTLQGVRCPPHCATWPQHHLNLA